MTRHSSHACGNRSRNTGRSFRAVLALAMAVLMLFPLMTDVLAPANAITKADIDALRQQKADISAQQTQAKQTLAELEQQENSAMERLAAIEDEIALLSDQINATQDIIDDYDALIAQTKQELAEAQADEDVYYQRFLDRVRAMEEQGQVSYWEILFQSSSFSDLLDRFSFVNDVMKYDNDMMDSLEAARLAVDSAEQRLEEEQAEQQTARDQLEAERAEQERAAEQEEAVLGEILANEELYADQIATLAAEETRLMGEITAAEEEYAAEQARLALEAQRRREEEERRRLEEEARRRAEEEERKRQEEEAARQTEQTEQTEQPSDDTSASDDGAGTTGTETKQETPVEVPANTGKNPASSYSGAALVEDAAQYVGVLKYVWGGSSLETGADCSGFVSAILRKHGLLSGRLTAASFASFGREVSIENIQVGDIIVYSNKDGTSSNNHVGFYAGNGQLLSAKGVGKGIGYCSIYYRPIYTIRRV